MITRYAFFEGAIKEGKADAFFAFVHDKLVPQWTRFEGALAIDVFRELERDAGSPGFPLTLAISYPDQAALERALTCQARFTSRDLTAKLMTMFDGHIHHHVTAAARFAPA